MHSRPSPRRLTLLGFLGALAVSGCGPNAPTPASRADRIGEDLVAVCTPTDAHAKHAAASVACVACHPCGGTTGFAAAVTYPGGTTSAGGTITPATATTPLTCSVGCHSPLGSGSNSVAWDAGTLACTACHEVTALLARSPGHPPVSADSSREYCEGCHIMTAHTQGTVGLSGHDDQWMLTTSATFHAYGANQGLTKCQGCHGPQMQGNDAGVPGCSSCHNGGTGAEDAVAWGCLMCHGGTDNQTGAPPRATWGHAGDPERGGGSLDPIRVGAHTAHVTPSAISPGFSCDRCHVPLPDVIHPDHADEETHAQVVFSGMAVGQNVPPPTWDRASATCSSTYCHGATMAGGSTPLWTGGDGEAACGSCHGVPPPPPHPLVPEGLTRCTVCHPTTMDGAGNIIPPGAGGGTHLNGNLESMGHDATWMDVTSPTFHAFAVDRDLQGCTGCHGNPEAEVTDPNAGGATGVSCKGCHNGSDAIAWNCVMCHGGTDNQTGAPPKALWGFAGDPDRGPMGNLADPLRVGAHTKHLAPAIMSPIACETCHVVPQSAMDAAHIDGSDALATVTFAGRAVLGGITNAAWSRPSGTCASTYCHGNYSGTYVFGVWDWGADDFVTIYRPYVGGRATPGWADAPMTCESCHGNPPAANGWWHSGKHGSTTPHRQCQLCHPDAYSTNGIGLTVTNPSQHVNGVVEVTPRWGSGCFGCH